MPYLRRLIWRVAFAAIPLLIAASPAGAVTAAAAPARAAPVILVAGGIEIDAPGTVDPGQAVTVSVAGGRADGRVELWGPDTGRGPAARISTQPAANGPVVVTAPATAGTYELRYVDGAGNLLARTSLDVAAIPIVLRIPDPFGAGYVNEVHWTGPGAPGDMIQIFDPASGKVVAETPAVGPAGAINVAQVRAPERYGDFEIRYWSGAKRATLHSIPIAIGAGVAGLRSPIEVTVGERFVVRWTGPVGADDAFDLRDPATDTVIARVPAGGEGRDVSVTLVAPSRPGAYRVRYLNTATGYIFSDLPLDVDPK